MKKYLYMVILTSVIVLTAGCSNKETSGHETENGDTNGTIQIVTTTAQIGEPLEVIGGDRVEVTSLMGPGVDPHLYEATQGDIQTLDDAEMVFYNGLNLEGNMGEIFVQMQQSKPTVAIAESIADSNLLEDEDGAVDPHIWFDITLWKEALNNAVEEMKDYSPENADYFEENKQNYFAELDDLESYASETLAKIPEAQKVLVTAHDAFGYLGQSFDVDVVGLQGLSTEDEVGISDIQSTVDLLIENQIPAVFVESSINEDTIQAVIDGAAEAGLEVKLGGELFSDAMGEAGTDKGTYLGMYRHNVDTIYQALSGEEEEG